MRECDIWKNASDAEFDNALEGMEKLVMNQLYQLWVARILLDGLLELPVAPLRPR
jgi:hypothetical protein